jgi:hypothetical protein
MLEKRNVWRFCDGSEVALACEPAERSPFIERGDKVGYLVVDEYTPLADLLVGRILFHPNHPLCRTGDEYTNIIGGGALPYNAARFLLDLTIYSEDDRVLRIGGLAPNDSLRTAYACALWVPPVNFEGTRGQAFDLCEADLHIANAKMNKDLWGYVIDPEGEARYGILGFEQAKAALKVAMDRL